MSRFDHCLNGIFFTFKIMNLATNQALKVDTLNIFLMAVALVAAIVFPFELFILAYAILGPLHYLTEINWLEKKSFFVPHKKMIWWFVIITVIITTPILLTKLPQTKVYFDKESLMSKMILHSIPLLFATFFTAIAMVMSKKWWVYLTCFIGFFILGELLLAYRPYLLIVGSLLPSLIHVFVFTFLFMLYGALKGKSKLGLLGSFCLLLVPVIIIFLQVNPRGFDIALYYKQAFDASGFSNLNYSVGWVVGAMEQPGQYYPIISEIGIKIQIFIAFAYTYHYLNWFSKTTVIGWHKSISKKKLLVILVFWIASLLLYWYSFYVGFLLLLFLSYLHVILEFPLNVTSIKEIGSQLLRLNKSS